jgi:hypothetical protein
MKNLLKIMITALSVVLIIAAMPLTASAEAQALGNESPFISAKFYDSNDNEVDGNALTANETYTANLVLSDISSVAIFNLTASFTDDITITNITSIAEVEDSGFEYGGYKIDTDNNTFVIVISTVSNTTYTDISGSTVMVTLSFEANTDGDFADFFTISTSRDDTFIIANFEEGNEAAYVYKDLTASATDFPYLDFDMSPSSKITVTGTVNVSMNEFGTEAAPGVVANATVDAVDANGTVVETTATDATGKFEMQVPADAVSLEIYNYRVPKRTITLSGNEVTDYPSIPVVAVDYDSNNAFSSIDKGLFLSGYDEENPDMDLDGNKSFSSIDKGIFMYFMNVSAANYADMTL